MRRAAEEIDAFFKLAGDELGKPASAAAAT
jgi:hypothetical protein